MRILRKPLDCEAVALRSTSGAVLALRVAAKAAAVCIGWDGVTALGRSIRDDLWAGGRRFPKVSAAAGCPVGGSGRPGLAAGPRWLSDQGGKRVE